MAATATVEFGVWGPDSLILSINQSILNVSPLHILAPQHKKKLLEICNYNNLFNLNLIVYLSVLGLDPFRI